MRQARVVSALLAVMIGFALIVGPAAADWGKTQVQLHCYKGNRDDDHHLGTVDVFDLARPSSHCNIMYNDCSGNCTACYTNEEGREVCADNSNAPYYHE